MPKLGEAFVVVRAALGPLKAGLAKARAAVKKAMTTISRTIKRMMLLVVAAITGAVWAAAKFEKQMAMISTMLDKKTIPIMEKYRRTIIGLAKEFGQATATLSKGLYDILSASIAAEKATGVLRIATKAAIAGMTETEVAADAITTIINSYGMNADRAAEISDKLFATVKRGKLTFAELAGSIGRAAATSAIAGLSFEELLSLTATLTRAGIGADEAMTSITGTMRAFLKPNKDAVETATKFGLELSSNTLKEKGFISVVKALNKASAEQLAMIVPNIRAFKALAAALKDTEGFTYDLNLITNQFTGMASEAYQKMSETASFQFDRLKQKAFAALLSLGEPLLGPFKRAMAIMSDLLQRLENWFTANKAIVKEWAHIVIDWTLDVIAQFEKWFDMIIAGGKEQEKAFKQMTESIIKIMKYLWERLKTDVWPYAREIGKAMAAGIKAGLEEEFPGAAAILGIPGRIGEILARPHVKRIEAQVVRPTSRIPPEAIAMSLRQAGKTNEQIIAILAEIRDVQTKSDGGLT